LTAITDLGPALHRAISSVCETLGDAFAPIGVLARRTLAAYAPFIPMWLPTAEDSRRAIAPAARVLAGLDADALGGHRKTLRGSGWRETFASTIRQLAGAAHAEFVAVRAARISRAGVAGAVLSDDVIWPHSVFRVLETWLAGRPTS
jgi:hypothetical protein